MFSVCACACVHVCDVIKMAEATRSLEKTSNCNLVRARCTQEEEEVCVHTYTYGLWYR